MTSVGFSPSLHVSHYSVRPSRRAQAVQLTTAAGEQQLEAMVRLQLQQYAPERFPWIQTKALSGNITGDGEQEAVHQTEARKREWRLAQQGKSKTLHFLLFMCLNHGCDPPDHVRIEPCAKLLCWCDPAVAQAKLLVQSSDAIGEALEAQYRGVQKEGVYKRCLEMSLEDARAAMMQMRRKAKDGRVLVHYNGHGMPRATSQGELWFFDKEHTHYHPLGIKDILSYCGSPTIFVLDCNGAGGVLNAWKKVLGHEVANSRDLFLCACSDGEYLPSNPRLPADILTSCLTTPVRIALDWYINYSHRQLLLPDVTEAMIHNIPGELSNRKTVLGEINWIFTAVTESIAWATLPRAQFYATFRTDLVVVKTLFRNFLLADKLLREMDCTPVSHPPLAPDTHLHEMWGAWEVALEGILSQLPSLLDENMKLKPNADYKSSPFFGDQLTAFRVWLDVGNTEELPVQLPCIVLGLVQTSYRVRALTLLCRYLDIPNKVLASSNALYCGAVPILTKLLTHTDVILLLIVVWLQLARVDGDYACGELLRHQAERSLLKLLATPSSSVTTVNVNEGTSHETAAPSQANAANSGSSASSPSNANKGSGMTVEGSSFTATSAATPPQATRTDSPGSAGAAGGNGAVDPPQKCYVMEGVTLERCKAIAAYLLCELMDHGGELLQTWCWNNNMLHHSFTLISGDGSSAANGGANGASSSLSSLSLGGSMGTPAQAKSARGLATGSSAGAGNDAGTTNQGFDDSKTLKIWGCLLQAKLISSLTGAKMHAVNDFAQRKSTLEAVLADTCPTVRATGCYLLGFYMGWRLDTVPNDTERERRLDVDRRLFRMLAALHLDPSPDVRTEVMFALCQLLYWYMPISQLGSLSDDDIQTYSVKPFKTNIEERGVQSALRAGPLDLSLAGDAVPERKAPYLTKNEPLPPPSAPYEPALGKEVKDAVNHLVSDSLIILSRFASGQDRQLAGKAKACLQALQHGECPTSTRLNGEVSRSMAGLKLGSESTEEERIRERRNADLMRQNILSNAAPQQQSAISTSSASAPSKESVASPVLEGMLPFPPAERGHRDPAASANAHPKWTQHALPVTSNEFILSAQFRLLESQVVHADRTGRVMVSSVESLERVSLRDGFQHDSVVQSLHLVNDLAETPICLLTDVYGNFCLYPLLTGDPQVQPLVSFSHIASCSPTTPPVTKPVRVVSEYRPKDSVLIYSPSNNKISYVSIINQFVIQQLSVPGEELAVTALAVERGSTNPRAVYAGMSDGGIRLFDDRTNDGRASLVTVMEDGHTSSRGAPATKKDPAILAVGTTTSQSTHIYAATANTIKVFDLRQSKKTLRSFEMLPAEKAAPAAGHAGRGVAAATNADGAATERHIVSCSISSSLPLIAAVGSDGTVEAVNLKGETLMGAGAPKPKLSVAGAVLPQQVCVLHPSKPFILSGTEIVALH